LVNRWRISYLGEFLIWGDAVFTRTGAATSWKRWETEDKWAWSIVKWCSYSSEPSVHSWNIYTVLQNILLDRLQ
jgi:hypothetical protein